MASPIRFPHGVTVYPPRPGTKRPRWRVTYRDRNGHRRNIHRQHQVDAEQAAWEVVEQLAKAHSDPASATLSHRSFGELLDHYLKPENRRRDWTPGHEARRRSTIETHIRPTLGDVPCRELEPADMRGLVATRHQQGLDVAQLHSTLTAVCRVGVEDGWFDRDPMRGVHRPRRGARQQGQAGVWVPWEQRPDTESVERLADAAEKRGPWWRGLEVRVAAYTGIRLGELFELRAGDLDLASGVISVDRQLTWVGAAKHLHLPKYGKRRVTFIPEFLAEALEKRVAEVDGEEDPTLGVQPCPAGCEHAVAGGSGGLLFPAPHGGWSHGSNHARRIFRPACEDAGWPRTVEGGWRWRWHDLRHHFCTWALAAPPGGLGLEVADVSMFAGHATPDFTMRAYTSTRPGAVERARAATQRIAETGGAGSTRGKGRGGYGGA